jgi:hypothetical protein
LDLWENLREDEEEKECAEDDQAKHKPADPAIPCAVVVAYSATKTIVVTASHVVSRMFGKMRRCDCGSDVEVYRAQTISDEHAGYAD